MRRPTGVIAAIGVAASGLLIGCLLMPSHRASYRIPFSHRAHLEEKLACTDCHSDAGTGPAQPDVCAVCHDRPQAKSNTAVVRSRVYESGPMHVTALDPERIFDHEHHQAYACNDCHGELVGSEALSVDQRLGKPDCMGCHEREHAPTTCQTCHSTIREDQRPKSHDGAWLVEHGGHTSGVAGDRCELCHTASSVADSCTGCHMTQAPRSHGDSFRRRGHGLIASMDRERCQTCHTTDTCERCHSESRPISHRGTFGAPRANHCLTCHVPLATQTECSICHSSTPSHLTGAPQPGWHSPGFNCRHCHGVGVALPHADNGAVCESCHP